jgi:hypothetical protein
MFKGLTEHARRLFGTAQPGSANREALDAFTFGSPSPPPATKPAVRSLKPTPSHGQAKNREPQGYPVGLVGESHYQPAIRKLSVGDPVQIMAEPTNPYDPEAIVVRSKLGQVIGYIPRRSFLMRLFYQEKADCSAVVLNITKAESGPSLLGVVVDVTID